jgi:hypothetical protein
MKTLDAVLKFPLPFFPLLPKWEIQKQNGFSFIHYLFFYLLPKNGNLVNFYYINQSVNVVLPSPFGE